MFGCVRRIGCLVLLLVIAAAAWFTRDRWLPLVRGPGAEVSAEGVWEPLTPAGAARARAAIQSLGGRSGPVYTSLHAGDLASYVFTSLSRQLPPSAQDVRAAVIGERMYVKALVSLSDFGGGRVLGPMASMLSQRDTVTFGGTFDVIRPGLAEYRVQELRFGQLSLPAGAIPKLLKQIERGARPEGLAPDGLPLVVPSYLGDVRVKTGRVTLYKSTP